MGYRLGQSTDEEGDVDPSQRYAVDIETRPTPKFIASRTATGTALLFSPVFHDMERHISYAEDCANNPTVGAKTALGLLCLGNAFRFIERLYAGGAIDFTTRRAAGNLLCEKFEGLLNEISMWDFSRGNSENAGCK